MSIFYVLLAMLAAAFIYAGASHQRLFLQMQGHQAALSASGGLLCAVAIFVAAQSLGFWAGFFAVLTALMLGCVLLPYVDAWRSHGNVRHVE